MPQTPYATSSSRFTLPGQLHKLPGHMKRQIISFGFNWNPSPNAKRGQVRLFFGPGIPPVDVPISSAEEFCAVAAILNESPVYLNPDGSITTEMEPVGGT
jgi:hypothetical protein